MCVVNFLENKFCCCFSKKKSLWKKVMAENIVSGNLTNESDGVTVSFYCTVFIMGAIIKRKKK